MKYLIIGAGGTGGSIGGFLASKGKDVTFIARGKHLEAISQNGLMVLSPRGKLHIKNARAFTGENYNEKADVIFVCVKCYSIDDVMPYIAKASHENTIVIPIMNVFGRATKIAETIPGIISLGSCIYIASDISNYGEIIQRSDIFKIIYGIRENDKINKEREKELMPILEEITNDLIECGIDAHISKNINEDVFRKFSFVSPMSATGAYFNVNAGILQREGKERDFFIKLIKEVDSVAKAMNINLKGDIVKENLDILNGVLPNMTSSFQKDLDKGGKSEVRGLIFDVLNKSEIYGVDVPGYKAVAEMLEEKYDLKREA